MNEPPVLGCLTFNLLIGGCMFMLLLIAFATNAAIGSTASIWVLVAILSGAALVFWLAARWVAQRRGANNISGLHVLVGATVSGMLAFVMFFVMHV